MVFDDKILNLGPITIEHIFYQVGTSAILFVVKDDKNTRYLISCCKQDEKYVMVETNAATLLNLMDNHIAIRDIFEKSLKGFYGIWWNGHSFHACYSFKNYLKDWLPRPKAKLDLQPLNPPHQTYYNLLKSEIYNVKENFYGTT